MNIFTLDFYQNQTIQMIYVCLVVFKKDQADSSNKKKQSYYMKCIGERKADTKVEEEEIKSISDKIYVLQETNKVQEGRFIFK